MITNQSIKIYGIASGDREVGIGSSEFNIDLGLFSLSEEDRKFIEEGIIRDMWELHDNGTLSYSYSDEERDRYMDDVKSRDILKRLRK